MFVWGHPRGSDDRAEISGLVPDGVADVMFTLANGTTVAGTVTDNGVSASAPSDPSRVTFRDSGGVLRSAPM